MSGGWFHQEKLNQQVDERSEMTHGWRVKNEDRAARKDPTSLRQVSITIKSPPAGAATPEPSAQPDTQPAHLRRQVSLSLGLRAVLAVCSLVAEVRSSA